MNLMCLKNIIAMGVELSDWLSMVAIIISLFTMGLTFYLENRRLKKEADAKFFQDIYFSYMKLSLPKAESNISYNSVLGRVSGITDMLSILKNLRKKTSPYRFLDKKFYDEFITFLDETEDFYSNKQNQVRDPQKFEQFQKESRNRLTALYSLLNDKFQNKKSFIKSLKRIFRK